MYKLVDINNSKTPQKLNTSLSKTQLQTKAPNTNTFIPRNASLSNFTKTIQSNTNSKVISPIVIDKQKFILAYLLQDIMLRKYKVGFNQVKIKGKKKRYLCMSILSLIEQKNRSRGLQFFENLSLFNYSIIIKQNEKNRINHDKRKKNNFKIGGMMLNQTLKSILNGSFNLLLKRSKRNKCWQYGLNSIVNLLQNRLKNNLGLGFKKTINQNKKKKTNYLIALKILKKILKQKIYKVYKKIQHSKQFKKNPNIRNSGKIEVKQSMIKQIQSKKDSKSAIKLNQLNKEKEKLGQKQKQLQILSKQEQNLSKQYEQLIMKNDNIIKQNKNGINQNKNLIYEALKQIYETSKKSNEQVLKKNEIIEKYKLKIESIQNPESVLQANINLRKQVKIIEQSLCPKQNKQQQQNLKKFRDKQIIKIQQQNQGLRKVVSMYLQKSYSNGFLQQVKNSYKQIIKTLKPLE